MVIANHIGMTSYDMKMYQLNRQQWIARPLDEVYEFFERPENLATITPASLDFQLLTPLPVNMQQGRIIDYTIRFLGFRLRWRSIISTHQPPDCFVDEQLKGPYSYWFHRHSFKREKGGTRIIDEVYYAMPVWLPSMLSNVMHRLLVRPELENIFDFRHKRFDLLFNQSQGRANDVPVPVAIPNR